MAIHSIQTQKTSTLDNAIDHFLSAVRLENEQNGQEGEALDLLSTYLRRYGKEFVESLDSRISQLRIGQQSQDDSDIATILTLVGRVEHTKSQPIRLKLLEKKLYSPQVRVRDGAVAGLGYIMSKNSIPALEKATKVETNRHLRRNMEQLLKSLQET